MQIGAAAETRRLKNRLLLPYVTLATLKLMPGPYDPRRQLDSVILLALLALLLFASPLMAWWARDTSPWYLPYLLWLLIILIGAWLHLRRDDHEL